MLPRSFVSTVLSEYVFNSFRPNFVFTQLDDVSFKTKKLKKVIIILVVEATAG